MTHGILISKSTRAGNIGLQGANLLVRFLFIFFLAKYLDPSEVGYYGLFAATVGYAIYFVGLDFYTYVTREILKIPMDERGGLLKSQTLLSGGLYLFFVPIFYILLYRYSKWPFYLMFWFFPILFLEHLNQEISRLLVALSEQIAASFVLFIRQGSWALVAVVLMYVETANRQLNIIMLLWALGGCLSATIGIRKLVKIGMKGWHNSTDWRWVKRGVVVSVTFLLATLALRGIQTFDRYWIEMLGGIDVVAAYVLYIGIAGSLLAFLDAGVFSFVYPILIKLNQDNNVELMRSKIKEMFWIVILLSLCFAAISWFILPYLLEWIGKETYIKFVNLYPWILLAMIINAIGLVPHYALYAINRDKHIVASHIVAFVVFGVFVWILAENSGPMAIPQSLAVSFFLILVWKATVYWYYFLVKPVAKSIV